MIALIVFGPGRLPEPGGSLGETTRGLNRAVKGPERKP
jgi:Sec-independent protein translocase protein TatA